MYQKQEEEKEIKIMTNYFLPEVSYLANSWLEGTLVTLPNIHSFVTLQTEMLWPLSCVLFIYVYRQKGVCAHDQIHIYVCIHMHI